jgi:hypothetical protein
MPLLDHFHPPLSKRRHWQNLHSAWANALRDQLNGGLLPPCFVAEVNVSLARPGGVALWAPPGPLRSVTLEASAADHFEVLIMNEEEGPRLVAAVELVSPANKDRPANPQAFVVKGASYLLQGVALVIVDIVTSRLANLHGQLLTLLGVPAEPAEVAPGSLYASAYRPGPAREGTRLDYWLESLVLGADLPTLPLWIAPDLSVPLPLDQAYHQACTSSRIAG